MKRHITYKSFINGMFLLMAVLLTSCYDSEKLNVDQQDSVDFEATELDDYIDENFVQKYGMAVRYKYVDSYLSPGQRVTPAKVSAVRPMLDFIEEYWAQPYLTVDNGEDFFLKHVPAEVILFGGLIYQGGTVLLGLAEAGARVTLLNVNEVDPNDQDWILFQLGTIYHEFAHVVHQRYKLPTGFENVSPTGYTGPGSWYVLTDEEALERGFVSPYGTSSVNEDYAEIVAFFLYDPEFHERFTIDEDCDTEDCLRRNEGREMLRQKLSLIKDHYARVTGIDLDELREATQSKIVKE